MSRNFNRLRNRYILNRGKELISIHGNQNQIDQHAKYKINTLCNADSAVDLQQFR